MTANEAAQITPHLRFNTDRYRWGKDDPPSDFELELERNLNLATAKFTGIILKNGWLDDELFVEQRTEVGLRCLRDFGFDRLSILYDVLKTSDEAIANARANAGL